MSRHTDEGTIARIVGRVLLQNAPPSPRGLHVTHERIKGAIALSVALRLRDLEAELQFIADHIDDMRTHCSVHDWTRGQIRREIERLIQRIA
jgi:hypothetical protein